MKNGEVNLLLILMMIHFVNFHFGNYDAELNDLFFCVELNDSLNVLAFFEFLSVTM